MAGGLDIERLDSVFKSRPDILKDIHKAADSPSRVQLFNKIASFVYEQIGDQQSTSSSLKRRRVDIEPSQNGTTQDATAPTTIEDVASENILLEIKDISVSIPQRKKFELCFTPKHIYARVPGTTTPLPSIVYAWKDIEYAFYLPVPEKSQVQHNYILFPRNSFSLSKSGTPTEEPLVFTVSAAAPKPGSIGGPNAAAASAVSDSYTTLFHWALNKCLQAAKNNVQIVAADPTKFHSKVRQPHRPKEPAVHVKAFRGSKDGYLFFLETGILWGFKKPLLFIPLDKIAAVSYTSVLQRTFNVVVEVYTGEAGDNETTEEIEFSMLDQEDYGGINGDYVMKHKLQDRSMADQRKAKRELAENAKGKKDADGEGEDANGDAGEDGMTELEKAQLEAEQQLQDEEDEDEEDYDPGSEGESEGSGTSDEEDDDDDDAAEDDEMDEDDE
ncbi:Rtt106-domain-containing protein [Annulohypoxylon maeteangense]|uniref:Rtt106-domain-containing protein n=1 Tax=Annulohypoxylon maeteangense TaxID=1927788 RepID=UPI0020088B62|nr:Rtt106-domain-containing protein [Annulohypoxylon maeteangense]KAI0885394.1 Rtt106-domain-containing protein [Annulohypoxylon maeteangense]